MGLFCHIFLNGWLKSAKQNSGKWNPDDVPDWLQPCNPYEVERLLSLGHMARLQVIYPFLIRIAFRIVRPQNSAIVEFNTECQIGCDSTELPQLARKIQVNPTVHGTGRIFILESSISISVGCLF